MKDLTDFAVLCKGVTIPSKDATLRVIPLPTAPSISEAIKGLYQGSEGSIVPFDIDKNMPKDKAGAFIDNVVKVQHKSDGYCRIVANLTNNPSGEEVVASAKGFVLIQKVKVKVEGQVEGQDTWKPIAVASLGAGVDITQPETYVAFTFSKTNNYQSVSFNPNAFATIEDINEINGLDGLHIAFDHASGDIKLLDGKGNVLDQANLHMDADTIIADGEEGYKYVKTDVKQDIHAEKAFMPEGKTAGADVKEKPYAVNSACFLVDVTKEKTDVVNAQTAADTAQDDVEVAKSFVDEAKDNVDRAQAAFDDAEAALKNNPDDQGFQNALADASSALATEQDNLATAQNTLSEKQSALATAQNTLSNAQNALASLLSSKAVREGTSPAICGIRALDASDSTHKDYIIGGTYTNPTIGAIDKPFLINESPKGTLAEAYSPDAFVLTVGNVAGLVKEGDADAIAGDGSSNVGKVRVGEGGTTTYRELTFVEKMNVNAQALGFHVGDDIPLGTNIATLIGTSNGNMSASGGFDAEKYMHEGTDSDYIDELVDAQRKLAKDELVEWNAQRPGLVQDVLSGTRISSDGVDIRNGKIEIGNGVKHEGEDNVKRYVIETDLGEGARAGKGLQIGVIDDFDGTQGSESIQKDILTINAEDYISGAPTCLALLKCSKSGDPATVSASLEGGRITANFTASGAETNGVFTLTITDNRANNGFGYAHRIVEIIPVYKSGADADEAVPAQRSISAIALAETNNDGKSVLSIRCSQVIDWAQSIDLGGTVVTEGQGTSTGNGMELYLIVKVY